MECGDCGGGEGGGGYQYPGSQLLYSFYIFRAISIFLIF